MRPIACWSMSFADPARYACSGTRPPGGLVGAGWCCRCAGLRSGAAVRKDAELVPLWVGKYDPALIACLADVGVPGTQAKQAADLFALLPVGWVDVEVEPVLDGLALGHVRECQRRWHRAKAVLAFRHHGGANCDNSVVLVLHLVVKDRAPEAGETVGIGTVDRKLGELTGHVRTSQSSSGSAKGHTLIAADDPVVPGDGAIVRGISGCRLTGGGCRGDRGRG